MHTIGQRVQLPKATCLDLEPLNWRITAIDGDPMLQPPGESGYRSSAASNFSATSLIGIDSYAVSECHSELQNCALDTRFRWNVYAIPGEPFEPFPRCEETALSC